MSSVGDEKTTAKIKAFSGDSAKWPVFKGKFKSLPARTDLPSTVNEHLIIELYSK